RIPLGSRFRLFRHFHGGGHERPRQAEIAGGCLHLGSRRERISRRGAACATRRTKSRTGPAGGRRCRDRARLQNACEGQCRRRQRRSSCRRKSAAQKLASERWRDPVRRQKYCRDSGRRFGGGVFSVEKKNGMQGGGL